MLIKIKENRVFKRQDKSFWVDSPGYCGLVTIDANGLVVDAIPPYKFMVGMSWRELKAYCDVRPGWSLNEQSVYNYRTS